MILLAGLIAGFWAAGIAVRHSAALGQIDRHVLADLVRQRSAPVTSALRLVTLLGSWVAIVAALAAVIGLAIARRLTVSEVVFALLVGTGAVIAVQVIKNLVRRPRPPARIDLAHAQGFAFPSGHSASAFFVFLTLAVLVTRISRRRLTRIAAWTCAVLIGIAVAWSRAYLGAHWVSDVIAGALISGCWLGIVAAIWPLPARARVATRTTPSAGQQAG